MKYLELKLTCESFKLNMNNFNTVIIENKCLYYEFLYYCFCGFGGSKNFIYSLEMSSSDCLDNYVFFVDNILDMNINTKKNINALYKIIKSKYFDNLKSELNDLKTKIVDIVSKISLDFDVELVFSDELTENDIFKIVDLRFAESDLDILHKLIKYIFVVNELLGVKIFVLHSLHSFLCNDQIEVLLKETSIRQISLIIIENSFNFEPIKDEIISIVDKDLCLIK